MSAPLHSTAAAAPMLGLSGERGVATLCRTQAIEHYRIESPGGRVRYLLSDEQIAAYLAKARVRAA